MDSKFATAFAFGFVVAAFLFTLPVSDSTKYRTAIKECEKSLPRDQHCIVIGVIEPYITK